MFRFGSLSLGALGSQDADSRDLFVGDANYHCALGKGGRGIKKLSPILGKICRSNIIHSLNFAGSNAKRQHVGHVFLTTASNSGHHKLAYSCWIQSRWLATLVTGLGFLFLAHTSSEVSSPVSSCRSSLSSVHTTGLPTSRATCRSQGRKSCE